MTSVETTSWWGCWWGRWVGLFRSSERSVRSPSRCSRGWWSNTRLTTATLPKWVRQLSTTFKLTLFLIQGWISWKVCYSSWQRFTPQLQGYFNLAKIWGLKGTGPVVWLKYEFSLIFFFFFFTVLYSWAPTVSFQSQQARLATLYLPLFGLLQENVYRLDIKESALFGNHNVSMTPSVGNLNCSLCL